MKSILSCINLYVEEQAFKDSASKLDDVLLALQEQGFNECDLQQLDGVHRKEFVSKMVDVFTSQQKSNHSVGSFLHTWEKLKNFSTDLQVDLKPLMVDALNKNALEPFTPQNALHIIRDFHWDPDFMTEHTIDSLMKKSDPQEAEEVLSHIPQECITARNGSLLYKTLRSYSFEEHQSAQSILALLQRIDPLKCVKPRFQDVSPDERILVTANLVPFLASNQQSQLLTLLDGSLNRIKNKSPLQHVYQSDQPKAQEFVRVWDHFKSQQKIKSDNRSSTKNVVKHKM